MITQIEIDGFKTFKDFKLALDPFQVIVGANGVGKSNLFDALRLLARLADSDLRSAFLNLRGEAGELFTALADGQTLNEMRFGAEMLVDRQVRDDWGAEAELTYLRLRYELVIVRQPDERGLERLYVAHEDLRPIARGGDRWLNRYNTLKNWLPRLTGGRVAFISTDEEKQEISLHQDGRSGRKLSVAQKAERTVLSSVINTEFPHAFAVREAMRAWRFLQLNPEVLRQPSPMLAPPTLGVDGSNLASVIARLEAEDSFLLNDISRDLANLVPGMVTVQLIEDRSRDQYLIQIQTQDGRSFSSRVLSDGTLRGLTLVTMKNDPQHRGVLCFEEPENGVHPFRLTNLVEVLRDLATDLNDPDQLEFPWRQLLVNTHSPVLANQKAIWKNLLFARLTTRISPNGNAPPRLTRIVPVKPSGQLGFDLEVSSEETAYTIAEVVKYLHTGEAGQTVAELQQEAG